MPKATGWLIANVAYGKIYVMDYSGTNYVYDPATDSWTSKAPVPATAFGGYASAVLDGKIYVIGGLSAFIYNAETDKWSEGSPPPSSQGGGAAGATTGALAPKRVYVFGETANFKQGENPDFVRVYNPKNDSWAYGADSPTDRYDFGVAIVNDTFYVVGGHTYNFPGNFAPSSVNEQYSPTGYGTPDPSYVLENTPPKISVLSPVNQKFNESSVPLSFTVDKPVNWTGYSLDGGETVTVAGNTTMEGLANGVHNVTVYATDTFGNTGTSETVSFSVEVPFPATMVIAPIASVVVVGAVLAFYFRKRNGNKR
jgi:hypothetical protein